MFNWQYLLLFFNFLIINPILTIDTPEAVSPANSSPVLRPATPPAVTPVQALRHRSTSDLATIDWKIILLNTPESILERKKFAQYYNSALHDHNSQFLAELITQVYRQIEWTISAAAGTNRLTPADIRTAVYQLKHICDHNSVTYSSNCCDDYGAHTVREIYSADRWQEIPIPCARHFGSDELAQIIAHLILLAAVNQKTHALSQLNPEAVSLSIIRSCDNPVFRFLRIHTLVQKLACSDNIAWLQRTILVKLHDHDRTESTAAASSSSEEEDTDCLSHTEWTLLLAR